MPVEAAAHDYIPAWLPLVGEALRNPSAFAARGTAIYLRALLGLVEDTPGALTARALDDLLVRALDAPPVPHDPAWDALTANDMPYGREAEAADLEGDRASVLTLIRGQTADLRWFAAHPDAEAALRRWGNGAAPRGTWANGDDLPMFLDGLCAGADAHELSPDDDDHPAANWWLLRELLLLGQLYE